MERFHIQCGFVQQVGLYGLCITIHGKVEAEVSCPSGGRQETDFLLHISVDEGNQWWGIDWSAEL